MLLSVQIRTEKWIILISQ